MDAHHQMAWRKERGIMVSPEHIDNQKSENQQAHSPAVEQQVPAGGEKKRTWLKPLMRGVGVVVPLLGGFAILSFTISNIDFLGWGLLLVACLLGVAGALLFRSWWAQLVIPLAFALGEFLSWYLAPVVFSPDPRFFTYEWTFGVGVGALFAAILATIGAFIGTSIVKKAWKEG
jgi:hypothetical protein